MNTTIIILYILVVILCLVTNALQAAALKSMEECRETDNKLITKQKEFIDKQQELIDAQREYIKTLEEEDHE
ncbi:MAG: hypothetical protein SOW50_05015 [Lachnospiraceae bacterium]|nr:hypothetical protein [Lachnospiraceae bacterium]